MPRKTTTKSTTPVTTAQKLGSVIKSARDIMRKDKGLSGELDRLPQLTWIMFLKLLDDVEKVRQVETEFEEKEYKAPIKLPYRWRDWAGNDHFSGDTLLKFINEDKLPLASLPQALASEVSEELVNETGEISGLLAYLRSLQSDTGKDRKDVIARGYIVLGITEKREHFEITGVNNPTQQKKDFWNSHNNSQKLSYPICQESDVNVIEVREKQLIIIKVPQADRTQRPVYLNNNPLTGTFKRNNDGDYRCQEYEVKQMLRDADSEPQDYQIIENFTLDDLDYETIKAFRNRFSAREPDHPFLAMETLELMVNLGGWKSDRTTGKEGLTYAGLLMFGKELSITQALPHYHLDYQERLSIDPEERWTYRITLDGRWQGNLFNFYYRVYDRLVRDLDLPLPFKLDEYSVREGETHVHQALREALSNCLIHADHYSTRPLKIVKLKDIFFFSNPGRLRIPINKFYQGGLTDPRNPHLQKMFQMVGLGDKAGSGVPKILRAWKEQQWVIPLVSEDLEVDMTTLALPMISLIPEEVEKELRDIVRDDYCNLKELERIVLVLAHRLGKINNIDIQHYSETHPRDIGDCLKNLVDKGWLKKSGHGRGTNYSLPNFQPSVTYENDKQNSDHLDSSSDHLGLSSDHLGLSSDHLGLSSDHFNRLID